MQYATIMINAQVGSTETRGASKQRHATDDMSKEAIIWRMKKEGSRMKMNETRWTWLPVF